MAIIQARSRSATSGDAIGHYRWIVIALIFIVYTAAYADRANIGIALPFIKKEFLLTNTQAGLLASAFTFAYALFQIPAAFVIRKFGARRSLPLFLILTSLTTLAIGLSPALGMILALRFLLGFFEAPLPVATQTTINNWFPRHEKGTATAILLTATKIAPLIVPPLGALILVSFGWRSIFLILAIPGVILALVWAIFVTDGPRESRFASSNEVKYIESESNTAPASESRTGPLTESGKFERLDFWIRAKSVTPLADAKSIFTSVNMWSATLGYFFIQGVVGFLLAWLPTYLIEFKKLGIMSVSLVAAAPFAGAVLGNLFGGILSDRYFGGRRKPTMLISCAFTVITMNLLALAPNSPIALSTQLFATGFLLSIGLSAFNVYSAGLAERTAFPLCHGMVNMGGQLGGAAIPFVTGVLLDHYNWPTVFHALAISATLAFLVLLVAVEPMRQVAKG